MNNNCQQLRIMFTRINSDFGAWDLDKEIERFMADPNNQKITDRFNMRLASLYERRERFITQYQKAARDLIQQWNYRFGGRQSIEFEDTGRIVIKGDLTVWSNLQKPPSIMRKVTGTLSFYAWAGAQKSNEPPELEADYIEEVGSLAANGVKIRPMKRLRSIEGNAQLRGAIMGLPTLEYIGGELDLLFNQHITSLPRLRKAGTIKSGSRSVLSSLESLEEVDRLEAGDSMFSGSKLLSAPKLRKASYVSISGCPIEEMPSLESVDDLWATYSKLKTTGKLKRLRKAHFTESAIETMPELESVDEDLHVDRVQNFRDAPVLTVVGGTIMVSGSKVADFRQAFPNLRSAGMSKGGDIGVWTDSPSIRDQVLRLKREGQIQMKKVKFYDHKKSKHFDYE